MKAPDIIKSFYPCIVGVGIIINQTLTIPSALAQITTDHTVGTEVEHITKDGILTITGGEQRGKIFFTVLSNFLFPTALPLIFRIP
ncbi:hypothetical protein [Crocosphaera watsonii]|uniref:hypothetical protein n=1 Tax=Crocosphaera watsonii TaxID=263511 RepID=UPI00069DCFF9|nr:hypothetical protein [Crocosphaera watsonii]